MAGEDREASRAHPMQAPSQIMAVVIIFLVWPPVLLVIRLRLSTKVAWYDPVR
jgi:hypothetical protein